MDNTLFLRIRIPDVPNAVVALNEVNLEGNLAGLDSEQIKGKCDSPGHELVYVHRGRALEKKLSLKDQGVRNNSTIYVMRKKLESESPAPPLTLLTDEKLKQITSAFKRFTASRLWELSHPRVLSRILKMYPAIRDDLGALAILRDPILLSSMKSPENFQEIAKQYPIFIQAASSIADILHKLDSTKVRAPEFEDSDSSSSSSSSDFEASMNNNNNNNNNNVPGSSRPITQQQLADALAYVAGAAFRGSLTQGGAEESGAREPMDQDESANEESRPQPPVVPSVPVGVAQPAAAAPSEDVRGRYSQELIQMREMGLIDEEVNLQALLICNGDLEAAINLVFSSTN